MPSTQLNIRLGSDNSIYTHDVPARVRRSKFNISRKKDFTLDPGAIVPVDLIETVPGDSFEISVNYLLKSMPLEVAPFTTYRIRTHWYYCRLVDLWKGAETFITKGRSGSVDWLRIPKVKPYAGRKSNVDGEKFFEDLPQSLPQYFGLPVGHYLKAGYFTNVWRQPYSCNYSSKDLVKTPDAFVDVNQSKLKDLEVNALPFMMYQKIYRMAYTVPNLVQDNFVWFPEDINDSWRINYDSSNLGKGDYNEIFVPNGVPSDETLNNSSSPNVLDTSIGLLTLRYALFEDDRFTTALPWAQRGSAPKLDVDSTEIVLDGVDVGFYNPDKSVFFPLVASRPTAGAGASSPVVFSGSTQAPSTGTVSGFGTLRVFGKSESEYTTFSTTGSNAVARATNASVTGLSFSLNQFRELVALSVWQERNSRTQGGYNETIFAHFSSSPRHEDYEPIYIGGTSDIIQFGEVIQTSSSQDSTPQGTSTGLAQVQSSGNVGYFRADDYGYIMGLMFIQPETVYTQGLEKLWFRDVMEDFFMPEYEGLGLEEVLNKEIMVTGTSDDDGLFGYQERNTEYKSRDNMSVGFLALPSDVDMMFSAYAQSRQFESLPKLSHQFVCMMPVNMRRDYLAVPSMPAFRCSFASQITAVRPMAYRSVPETFGF